MNIDQQLIESSRAGNLEKAKELIIQGANLNYKDNDRYTPLFNAIQKRQKEMAIFLIESGTDLNVVCAWDEWTYLIKASYFGMEDIVKILIDKGLNVNAKTVNGETAILGASSHGDINIVKLLLENGADPDVKTTSNVTPLRAANNNGHKEIVSLLESFCKGTAKIKSQSGWLVMEKWSDWKITSVSPSIRNKISEEMQRLKQDLVVHDDFPFGGYKVYRNKESAIIIDRLLAEAGADEHAIKKVDVCYDKGDTQGKKVIYSKADSLIWICEV